MIVLDTLAADDVSRVTVCFRDALRDHQDELNRLNVYPVPDGDTGTNMALTIESVVAELAGADDMGSVCAALAHGSLMGARGNSGVILSQVLRGLAEIWRERAQVRARDIATALRRATDAAYDAVLRPVEGTILTVVRKAAEACEARMAASDGNDAGGDPPLGEMVEVASIAAARALAETPDQLAVLAEAGVVDAGGKGFTLLLDALRHVVGGRPVPRSVPALSAGVGGASPALVAVTAGATVTGSIADGIGSPRYEVMFLLEGPSSAPSGLRQAWDAIGESIVVTGGEGVYNCHVHTDDIGAAIEAGIALGRPHRIRVTDLHDESATSPTDAAAPAAPTGTADLLAPSPEVVTAVGPSAVVAVAAGAGVEELFLALGVAVVVPGGQTMNPSTADLLSAVRSTGAEHVIVLPNNKNIVAVAHQLAGLAELAGQTVHVVATHSVAAGLSAMVAFDADTHGAVNRQRMGEAAERTRTAEVARAVRNAATEVGAVTEGQWIALADQHIVGIADDALTAVLAALATLVEAHTELVTVLVGAHVDAVLVDAVRQAIADTWPALDIEVLEGGQPHYPFVIGVE